MGILSALKKLLKKQPKSAKIEIKEAEEPIYKEEKKEIEVHSIWDYLQFNENTQAFHLTSVIRFDEWVDMDEIRRRIFELFQIDYKNERSLYPYLKTMVDLGLIETSNIGGRRKWRKRDLIVKVEKKKKKSESGDEEEELAVPTTNQ